MTRLFSIGFFAAWSLLGCERIAAKLHPPPIEQFTLVPFGDVPELAGVVTALAAHFPGVPFAVAPVAKLPNSVLIAGGSQALDEAVIKLILPRGRGTVAVLAQDLSSDHTNFLFSSAYAAGGVGVVSVARFRTAAGDPEEITDRPDAVALGRSKPRLVMQLVSLISKLFGLKPCADERCVLHYPNTLEEFDRKGGNLCVTHQQELKQALAARTAALHR